MKKNVQFFLIISIIIQLIYIILLKIEFKPTYILNSFKKDFKGDLKLPNETIEIKEILSKTNDSSFNLSNEFKKDSFKYQRTIEYIYPFKLNQNYKFYFEFLGEQNSKCQLISKHKFIQISKCNLE
tara:strand:- start:212 stop:589 length:378 start_codon:yes stop_codon:yes gene_type:complete